MLLIYKYVVKLCKAIDQNVSNKYTQSFINVIDLFVREITEKCICVVIVQSLYLKLSKRYSLSIQ